MKHILSSDMLQLFSRLTNNSLDVQDLRVFLCFREDYWKKAKSLPFQLPCYMLTCLTDPGTNFPQFSDEEMAWVNINHEVQVLR